MQNTEMRAPTDTEVEASMLWDAHTNHREAKRGGDREQAAAYFEEILAIRRFAHSPIIRAKCDEIVQQIMKACENPERLAAIVTRNGLALWLLFLTDAAALIAQCA